MWCHVSVYQEKDEKWKKKIVMAADHQVVFWGYLYVGLAEEVEEEEELRRRAALC